MMLATGTVLGGRYEILEKIGTGGMAVVYRGNDLKLDRVVTVKVLKEEYTDDEDFKTRFKIEARAAAKLSHPNIVNVYDVGEEGNIQYIVMEYVHGDTLKQVIINSAPLDNITTLSIAVQMASALTHAHKNGVIHRDIKPHNILVSVDGNIKVTDFGIARAAAVSTVTTTANALGSVYYFSPEQARGGYVDEKSDIYSLGITMFEMLTGKVPYNGDTSVAIALQHINSELPDMKEFNHDVSETIQRIVHKATEKKKDDRYANIGLLMQDLKKALSEGSSSYKKRTDFQQNEKIATTYENKNESNEIKTVAEASAAASTIGISKAAENGVEASSEPEMPEIKVELSGPRKDAAKNYDLPERAVDFDMYNKKFSKMRISKGNDDEYEYDDNQRQPSQKRDDIIPSKHKRQQNKTRNNQTKNSDEYYKEKEKKVTIAAIITSLVIIAFISFAGFRMLNGQSIFGGKSEAETSQLPNFENIPFDEASKTAEEMGITLVKSSEEYNEKIAEGNIINQSVKAGTSVGKGDTVEVAVSLGFKSFEMPDVTYDELETAVEKIKNQGGKEPEIEYEFDESVPAGVVIEQTPKGQTKVTPGTKILLKVSKGPESDDSTVPDFIGMQIDDARKLASQEGVSIGNVTENKETEGVEGRIIDQSIDKGTKVDQGTSIDIVVIGKKEEPEEENNNTPPDDSNNEQTPESNVSSSKTFAVNKPDSYNNQDSISVKMLKITNGSSVEVVYNETKTINDFPFSVTLSGSGKEEIQLYIDNIYQWSETVDFSEGGN